MEFENSVFCSVLAILLEMFHWSEHSANTMERQCLKGLKSTIISHKYPKQCDSFRLLKGPALRIEMNFCVLLHTELHNESTVCYYWNYLVGNHDIVTSEENKL